MNNPAQTVAFVAKREFTTRVRTKAFLISNAIILVVILGGIVAVSLFGGSSHSATKLGLVGNSQALSAPLQTSAQALGKPLQTSMIPDDAAARAKVRSGDLDAALIPGGAGTYTTVVDKQLAPDVRSVIDTTVRQQAVDALLRARNVDPAQVAQAGNQARMTVDALNPPDPNSTQRTTLAYIAVLVMYFQLVVFGLYVGTGVVEEKSSRVVEVLLATIKPLHLLWGKVLGIGAVGLVQLLAYGAVGLSAGIGTGVVTVTGTAVAVFASVFGWFILGFALFAMLYAAAGSLVSRQEDVNAASTPITVVIFAMFFLALATLQNPGGTLASVMSWIPPFSAMLMPLRIAAGVTGPVQVVGSALIMIAVTAALAVAAAKIYERSVLRSGKRVSWKEALRASPA